MSDLSPSLGQMRKAFEKAIRDHAHYHDIIDLTAYEVDGKFDGYRNSVTDDMFEAFKMGFPKVSFSSWYEEFHNCFREYGEAAKDIAQQAFDGARGA